MSSKYEEGRGCFGLAVFPWLSVTPGRQLAFNQKLLNKRMPPPENRDVGGKKDHNRTVTHCKVHVVHIDVGANMVGPALTLGFWEDRPFSHGPGRECPRKRIVSENQGRGGLRYVLDSVTEGYCDLDRVGGGVCERECRK